MGEAPDHIVLIETEEDVDRLEVDDPSRIAYISQTTLSVDETRAIIAALARAVPRDRRARAPTTSVTRRRTGRPPCARWRDQCDLVLVIGSKNSSNSNRLVEVARAHGAESHLIDNESAGARGVARGQAHRGHHVRRERSRGARPAARRVLPRARHEDVSEFEVVQEDVRFMLPKEIRKALAAAEA